MHTIFVFALNYLVMDGVIQNMVILNYVT